MIALDVAAEAVPEPSASEWTPADARTLAGVLGFVVGLAFFGPPGAALGAGGSWLVARIAIPC